MPEKTASVKITEEALQWARRASGFTSESVLGYISRVVSEQGRLDVERLSKEALSPEKKRGKS